MSEEQILQLGAVAVLFAIAIREFFAYLKAKKNGEADKTNRELLSELKLLNENHLNSIQKAITDGNRDIVEAVNNGNLRIVEKLGEICGRLDK